MNVQLGAEPVSIAIPTVAQLTGSLAFPAVRNPTTIEIRASASAPSANLSTQVLRRTQTASGVLTVYEYVTITPRTTVILPSLPALHITFPPANPIAGKSFYYGISDPDASNSRVSFDTEGPGYLSGQGVTFAPVAASLTLLAGQRYTFVVYSVVPTIGEASRIYIITGPGTNTGFPPAGSLATYFPDGTRTAPTIAGEFDSDGRVQSSPRDVAVDLSGKIYLTNDAYCKLGPTCAPSTVTTYTADGVPTAPTIELPPAGGINALPGGVAVDAAGKIYVVSALFGVLTYRSDGSQTTPTIIDPQRLPHAVAVDRGGKIFVSYDDGTIRTFRPDGTPTTPTLRGYTNAAFDAVGTIYVGTGDSNVADSGTIHTYKPDGSPGALTIRNVPIPSGIAVDAAGKIYVASSNTNVVVTFDADGSRGTISINGVFLPQAIAVH